jgi:hypothetical protein
MKTTSIILAGLLGATLFTGCKKEDNTISPLTAANAKSQNPAVTESGGAAAISVASSVNYQLFVTPSAQGAPFQWMNGQITVAELLFHGDRVVTTPNDLTPITITTPLDLTAPLSSPIALGKVDLPRGIYHNIRLELRLLPLSGPSLILTGAYDMDGTVVNIRMMIEEELRLSGAVQGPRHLAGVSTALLHLNMDAIAANISPNLIHEAIRAGGGGTLVISRQSNTQLYQAVLAGILNAPLKVDLVPALTSNTTFISVANDR